MEYYCSRIAKDGGVRTPLLALMSVRSFDLIARLVRLRPTHSLADEHFS